MIKLSTEWLSACGGCHVAILDLHEKIFNVLKSVQICHSPILTDIKDYPEADVGIITGALRTEENYEAALKMRESCKTIIALGTCSVLGGISGAGSVHSNEEIYSAVYTDNKTTATDIIPNKEISKLRKTVTPLDQAIEVDYYLSGCPPHPLFILQTLSSLLNNKPIKRSDRSVCGRCKREMVKTEVTKLKRFTEGIPDETTCFLSQGYLCLGSVSMDRCLSPCTAKGMVCTGCTGPTIQLLQEPNIDIRTELADLISRLTSIQKEDIIKTVEKHSKTHYAYSMASPMIGSKPTFLIKQWINR